VLGLLTAFMLIGYVIVCSFAGFQHALSGALSHRPARRFMRA